jgi:hypothetical protein
MVGLALLRAWAEESADGAAQALSGARVFLEGLRAAARRRQQAALGHAKRFMLHFDGVAWALCHERTPFVRAVLTGILLENVRSIEGSGSIPASCLSLVTFRFWLCLWFTAGTDIPLPLQCLCTVHQTDGLCVVCV